MKRLFTLLSIVLISITTFAQDKLTLEDIWVTYKFYPASVDEINSSNDGQTYTILAFRSKIERYKYSNGKLVETVLSLSDIPDKNKPKSIYEYSFSNDESKILIASDVEHIYRHSYRANFFVWDIKTKQLTPVYTNAKQQEASFSPDGSKVAFVVDNNLYIKDLSSNKITQITTDGKKNFIINGIPDWVYEEEFSFARAYEWSPNSDRIAFLRFDESDVKEYSFPVYGDLYPEQYTYKYPKAGEKNSIVTVHIYDLNTGKTIQPEIRKWDDYYIPRIKWTKNNNLLLIERMNRLQNELDMLLCNAQDGKLQEIYVEKDEKYIEINDFLTFLPDGKQFIMASEKDGYQHLYLYDLNGNLVNQITKGKWEVVDFKGYDSKHDWLYYLSNEISPTCKTLYKIHLDGSGKTLVSPEHGVSDAEFSSNFSYYILSHSTANTPPVYTLFNAKGRSIRVLEDNHALAEKIKAYNLPKKEFFTVTVTDGTKLNGWMIKPANFDKNKKYPVFMTVYGGPGNQTVIDQWEYTALWHDYIADQGYIVVSVDNRGTNGRGKAFRQATYGQMGKIETQDQIDVVKYLRQLPYIDSLRVGIQGWSYGGFMATSCLEKGAEYFKAAIAVAPVTNWRYYDSIYTERYMGLPQDNAKGYDDNSPINHVKKIKGKFMLAHGTADDNVHFQNTIELIRKLVDANKHFDLMIYPNSNHGIYTGRNTRYHLFSQMTDFILENI